MPKAKELALSHENMPGMLASIAKVLGNERVNILSFLTITSGTTGTTHLVVDNIDKAKKAFANARLPYTEADVLRVELPNTPGALARFAVKRPRRDQHHARISDERQGLEEGEYGVSRFPFRQGGPAAQYGLFDLERVEKLILRKLAREYFQIPS